MQKKCPPSLVERLFSFWLLGVAASLLLLVWAFFSLGSSDDAVPAGQQGKTPASTDAPAATTLFAAPVPPFDADNAPYLLSVFSTQGIRRVADAEPLFTLLEPGNELNAQLIRRDMLPEATSKGHTLRYTLDPPYAVGQNAHAAQGTFRTPGDGDLSFASSPIPLMPVTANGTVDAYPTALAEALDADGTAVAATRVVLPVSAEVGCRSCHTGPWKTQSGGVSAATAKDILALHDRYNNTALAEEAAKGGTVECASCHMGGGGTRSLSAALHGFHATMKLEGANACSFCHASSEEGSTRFYRDFHSLWGLDCTRCHGSLNEHAAALLLFEVGQGNSGAQKRLEQASAPLGAGARDINPREPYVNMPHCAGCHDFKKKPDANVASAFNKWTANADERFSRAYDNTGQVRCSTCHGPAHALYPADGPAGDGRDNIQPMQYQKFAAPLGKDGNCAVCHTVPMEGFVHHDIVEQ